MDVTRTAFPCAQVFNNTWQQLYVLAACFMLNCGAASTPIQPPSTTIVRFIEAIRTDNPKSAYMLIDQEARQKVSFERFSKLWYENRQEMLQLASTLDHLKSDAKARARVPLISGERVVLVLEDGTWHVEGGVLDAVALGTPLDTVAALRSALQRRDLNALLRILSRKHRTAWEATLEQTIEQTSDPLDMEVEIQGDQALVQTTGGTVIRLLREGGKWRVVDVR